jgi:pilus assembly protein CpaC
MGVWASRLHPVEAGVGRTSRPIPAFAVARWLAAITPLPIVLLAMPTQGSSKDCFEVVVGGRPTIDLNIGAGRLLHFDGPVESVFIADPSVAGLQVVSADSVYVYGKKSGITNLIATSTKPQVRASVEFRVGTNPELPNEAMRKLKRTTTFEISILGERTAVKRTTCRIEEAVFD